MEGNDLFFKIAGIRLVIQLQNRIIAHGFDGTHIVIPALVDVRLAHDEFQRHLGDIGVDVDLQRGSLRQLVSGHGVDRRCLRRVREIHAPDIHSLLLRITVCQL